MSNLSKGTNTNPKNSEKISTIKNDLHKAWLSKQQELDSTQSLNSNIINATNGIKTTDKSIFSFSKKGISQSKDMCSHHKSKHRNCKCLKKRKLSQKHFDNNGVVITKPGYYCITEDIIFNPSVDNVAAITIRANNVIIDFETHRLQQSIDSFNAFDNVSAVLIESGFNFIKIFNGSVSGFSDQGIIADTLNFDPSDHHDIVVSDMSVGFCGKLTTQSNFGFGNRGGITILGVTDCTIRNCDVFQTMSQFDTEAIAVFFCNNVNMSNLSSHDNQSDPSLGLTVGITVSFYDNAINENCIAFNNSGVQVFGNSPFVGSNLTMIKCRGNQNKSLNNVSNVFLSISGGIGIYNTNGGILKDCEGNYNTVSEFESNRPAFSTGIQTANSQSIVLDFCTANYNFAAGTTVRGVRTGTTGFDINTCSDITLRNCNASENSADTQAAGEISAFDCDRSDHVLHENCVAIGNTGSVLDYGNVTGFYASIRPEGGFVEDIIYRNCVALRQSSDVPGTAVAGFLSCEAPGAPWIITNNRFIVENCISESNINTSTPETGYGVFFAQTTLNSSITKCKITGNGIGILLSGADTKNNLVISNQVTNNSVYGIQDTTGNSNSYAKNYCYDNNVNYSGLPIGTPIRDWQIGFPPLPVNNNGIIDPLDNFNVTN